MSPGVPNGHRLPGGMMLLLGDWHAVGFMRLHAGARIGPLPCRTTPNPNHADFGRFHNIYGPTPDPTPDPDPNPDPNPNPNQATLGPVGRGTRCPARAGGRGYLRSSH